MSHVNDVVLSFIDVIVPGLVDVIPSLVRHCPKSKTPDTSPSVIEIVPWLSSSSDAIPSTINDILLHLS